MGDIRKKTKRKPWSQEDVERLIELRNKYTKKDIARLMKRSTSSVNGKIQELGLGGLLENTDKWTFQQIKESVGLAVGSINKTWVKRGLKFVKRQNLRLVSEEDLLKFMKENTDLWDATKCDYYLFYQYPWFMKKLEEDKKIPYEKKKYYWTDYQKQQFIIMKKRGFTHREIAEAIGKTKRAVDHHSAKMGKAV